MNVPVVIAIVVLVCSLVALGVLAWKGRSGKRFSFDIGGAAPTASGGDATSAESGFASRIRATIAVVAVAFGAVAVRLWGMQIVDGDDYSHRAENNRTRTVTTRAPRGRILDRNGVELVTNRPSLTVVGDSSLLDDEVGVRLLSSVLGMPMVAVRRKLQDQTEGAQSARAISVDASRRVVAYLGEHAKLFPGVTVEQRSVRNYPLGSCAAHVLGYTGVVGQKQLDEQGDGSDGTVTYRSGDTVGQAGIEYQYDSVLAGVRGEQVVYVDADGNVTSRSDSVEPQAGSDLVLTIDVGLQQAAEAGLQHGMEMARMGGYVQANKGAVIVLDATNGEVLALASAPTYNPNVFVGGLSNDDWNQLSAEGSGYPLMNRAVSGQYPSASTIKPVVGFCALDKGVLDLSTTYYCTGFWTGFGEAFGQYCWEHKGHGTMNLETGIIYSCDTVFYEIGKSLFYSDDQEALQNKFRSWGLGAATGIDLPSEALGRVPDAAWKWDYFEGYEEHDRQWQGGDMTNLCIGQGFLLVTPLQMASLYVGLATRGTIWRPHLLKSVRAKTGEGDVVSYVPQVNATPEEPVAYFDVVQRGLDGVIYQESENMTAHFTSLPVRVMGKTGTGEASGNRDPTGWFMAIAPEDSPKYVVCAMLEEAGFGSTSAMYAVRDTLGYLYASPDTSTAIDDSGAR